MSTVLSQLYNRFQDTKVDQRLQGYNYYLQCGIRYYRWNLPTTLDGSLLRLLYIIYLKNPF